MGDSQKLAPENSPQIAKIIAIHQNFRRYCRKAILYPIWSNVGLLLWPAQVPRLANWMHLHIVHTHTH